MKITKQLRASIFLTSSILIASVSNAAFAVEGTPTQYHVTVSAVEFHRTGDPAGTFVTYANSSGTFDIASANPGQAIGVLSSTDTLPAGDYDEMRFTISKTMSLQGSSSGTLANGVTCRTITGAAAVSDPFGDGSVDSAYVGATDGATPTLESVAVPSGSAITLPTDLADLGTSFQVTTPMDFTVTDSPPDVTVKFDVTDAMDFLPYGATSCIIFPGAPTVTVTIA